MTGKKTLDEKVYQFFVILSSRIQYNEYMHPHYILKHKTMSVSSLCWCCSCIVCCCCCFVVVVALLLLLRDVHSHLPIYIPDYINHWSLDAFAHILICSRLPRPHFQGLSSKTFFHTLFCLPSFDYVLIHILNLLDLLSSQCSKVLSAVIIMKLCTNHIKVILYVCMIISNA